MNTCLYLYIYFHMGMNVNMDEINHEKARKAIAALARKKGLSETYILEELEAVIAAALNDPKPEVRALWQAIPHEGEAPTPVELIAYIGSGLKEQQGTPA